ncbi:MAG: hypothetical protein HPY76_11210 [Anaerolineae bacterium]|nr:hypothetical protein [Anaerolineae bacterium]
MIEIKQVDVNSRKEVNQFVDLHYRLYNGCPQWVPPFKNDIKLMMDPKKHPYYEHSVADFFVALQDGEVVGRIAAMENLPFNKYHQSKKAQFYLFDCVDDQEVADALFSLTFAWAKSRGLTEVLGPKGFGPLDGYGIQVEGFEHRQMMNMMNYNYPYYPVLFEKAGFAKVNEFVSCYINPQNFSLPDKVRAIATRVKEIGNLSVKQFKNKKDLINWGLKIGETYNNTFVNNWEYYPLTEREIKLVVDNIMLLADPKLMKILTRNDDVVGFLLVFPDISAAMQRHNGNLTPWALVDLMLEVKRTGWISLNGVGMLPEYQGRGGNALMYYEIEKTLKESKIANAEQTQMADTAVQVRKDMETLGAKIYKRHRIYGIKL